nr:MAG TPA: hypothetical protein [Caudoviricetes sp.]
MISSHRNVSISITSKLNIRKTRVFIILQIKSIV